MWPLEAAFRLVTALRRQAFVAGWLSSHRLPVPVVIVGNITVGGSGKTPAVAALVIALRARGHSPGIISRGYGGSAQTCMAVGPDSPPALVGDEPVLLARHTGCPVFIGRDRVAAGRALLAAHPQTSLILCDDGLQHYRLARQLELVVVDGLRGFGNARLLPLGPLREPLARLRRVDALLINGSGSSPPGLPPHMPVFHMLLQAGPVYPLGQAHQGEDLKTWLGHAKTDPELHALAGIGHPERFFTLLRGLGLDMETHPFPDHHVFSAADLQPFAGKTVLVTEKDAVKLERLMTATIPGVGPHNVNIRVVPVTARFEPDLCNWLCQKLPAPPNADGQTPHGSQTA